MEIFIFIIVCWLAPVICGGLIGERKNQLTSGIVWTMLLGWIGFIIVLCLPNLKEDEEKQQATLRHWQQMQAQAAAIRQQREMEVSYHVFLNNEVRGPWSMAHIQKLRQAGAVNDETQVMLEGDSEWQPLKFFLPA